MICLTEQFRWNACMENLPFIISAATLAFGAGLGLKGLFDPRWAGKLVRLQPENGQPEGFAEFRSTLGGMFLGLHLVALLFVIFGGSQAGVAACVILAAGWLFTAVGRFMALKMDEDCNHSHVKTSIGIEVVAGLLILVWPIAQLF
jgi:hypothetical protein